MINQKAKIIIVTPVFEDSKACSELFFDLFSQFGNELYIVAVDDGSIIQLLDKEHFELAGVHGTLINLRRNCGHQTAIAVGINYVKEFMQKNDILIIMDSDGEDMPSTIPILLEKLEEPGCKVAVAERKKRHETIAFKIFYFFYKKFFSVMTGKRILFGNFMALDYFAVNRIVSYKELHTHLAATVLASRLPIGLCPIDRGKRYDGNSKMNLVSLMLHGFKGLMVFVEDVLVRVGIACASIALCSFLGILLATALKFLGFSTPGWFSVALGILVLMLLQTGALALTSLLLTVSGRGAMVSNALNYKELIAKETKIKLPESKSSE